jgi:hypothetical protein
LLCRYKVERRGRTWFLVFFSHRDHTGVKINTDPRRPWLRVRIHRADPGQAAISRDTPGTLRKVGSLKQERVRKPAPIVRGQDKWCEIGDS